MMDNQAIENRYSVGDFAIRYVGENQQPSADLAEDTIYLFEPREGELYRDPLGEPVIFYTEAEAFACRNAFGHGLVLSMCEGSDIGEMFDMPHEDISPEEQAKIDQYLASADLMQAD